MTDVRLDEVDLAGGMILGSVEGAGGWTGTAGPDRPIEAVEAVVLAGLVRPPCLVSFSGGRDSSALLAVAVQLAKREGLDAPVPITARFPGEETDEAEWQELVIRHVGAPDWIQVEMTEELDLLGEWGTSSLRRLGLRYPPNLHFQVPLLRRAEGGSLLSGAGGDELLVPHRWARAGQVLSGTVRLRPVDALVVGVALAPRPIRVRMHQGWRPPLPSWLSTEGRRVVQRRLFRWVGADPARYDEHLAWWRNSRYLTHGQRSLELLAEDHGVAFLAPFSETRVLRALAKDRGGAGFASRTEAMRYLFGDLLPEELIGRRSKASFLSPLVGPMTRAFASEADPEGVISADLADYAHLRQAWHEEAVDIRSLPALQACWLAANAPEGDHGASGVVDR